MFNFYPLRNCIFRSIRNDFLSQDTGLRRIAYSYPLALNVSPSLMALPVKKKKRLDPQIIKLREERRKKKIEKEIRNLQKYGKALRPIEEMEIPEAIYRDPESRRRHIEVSPDKEEERILIVKEWCKLRHAYSKFEKRTIKNLILSRERALSELQKESEELYNAALEVDMNLLSFDFNGPTDTPPFQEYPVPDGDYIDISKKWLDETPKY